MSERRTEIQVLRGFAVLLVLCYHAVPNLVASGFLGVDIFFVISGFLITGLIARGLDAGTFQLGEFFFRRAKRLLPAAFTVFAAVAALAPWFLTSGPLSDLKDQLIGAVTYTANFVIAGQTGYFAAGTDQKPLLHIWSLAVEEQYYLLLPIFMLATPRRFLLWTFGILTIASATVCFCQLLGPIKTFYLLPARAWELGVGSVGALVASNANVQKWARRSLPLAWAATLVLPFLPQTTPHPAMNALAACLACLVILLAPERGTLKGPLIWSLAFVGDLSYSLYLVHWPLFVFWRQAWIGESAPLLVALQIGLAMVLGFGLFLLVERPARQMQRMPQWLTIGGFAAGTLCIPALAVAHDLSGSPRLREGLNQGLGEACEFGAEFVALPQCVTSDQPTVLVWGDSFAMHLVPGLLAGSPGLGLAQATKSVCGPTVGAAAFEERLVWGYNRTWADGCLSFNNSVLTYLAATPSIEIVVLSTPLRQYIDQPEFRVVLRRPGGFSEVSTSAAALVEGFRQTVLAVRSLGKKVVLIAPPPTGRFNSRDCLQRRAAERLVVGPLADCTIPVLLYRHNEAAVLAAIQAVADELNLGVISFDSFLCDQVTCRTAIQGEPIYLDPYHLSRRGSEILAIGFDLIGKINTAAR